MRNLCLAVALLATACATPSLTVRLPDAPTLGPDGLCAEASVRARLPVEYDGVRVILTGAGVVRLCAEAPE